MEFKEKNSIYKLTVCLALGIVTACNASDFKGSQRHLKPVLSKDFTQAALPVQTAEFTQGHSGEPQAENFEQGEWGPLDILVVIDDSGSMVEEQANLSTKMQPLLSKIDKADWQVAVATTDPSEGCQRALIKKGDADAAAKFEAAIKAGTNGSGLEQGVLQAVRGLGGADCTNLNWVRPDSAVAVLIVSDEDNCHLDTSRGYGCDNQPDRHSAYLTDYLSSIRTLGKDARVYGLIWHPSQSQSACSTALKSGDEYAAAIDLSGGQWGSICASDYTATLSSMSDDVAQILKYEFDLEYVPDAGTLKITVDGQDWQKFTLSSQHVKFSEAPPFGSKVEVSYKHGAEGELNKDFPVAKDLLSESLKIQIDGQDVSPDTYKWDAQAQELEFATPPGEKSAIKVEYKTSAGLQSEFQLDPNVDPATITVTINGQAARDFVFDGPTGLLKFTTPPPEAAAIHVTYMEL